MAHKITFLGTGGSSGIPQIGCRCEACSSADPKNRRYRTSILVEFRGRKILFDTAPEFRLQMLEYKVDRIDALIYTHAHADHVMGLPDIRSFNFLQGTPIDTYATAETIRSLKESFSYIFNAPERLKQYMPQLHTINIEGPFVIHGLDIIPFTVYHASMPVLGFRFENTAYITDVNHIPEQNFALLEDLDLLILEAFRYQKHISHYALDEAIDLALRVGAKRTLFTHISHAFEHEQVNKSLPKGITLAYDGQSLSL